ILFRTLAKCSICFKQQQQGCLDAAATCSMGVWIQLYTAASCSRGCLDLL
ncbi:hypothetical protein Tco_0903907, partial [Tanacetum coccineum]